MAYTPSASTSFSPASYTPQAQFSFEAPLQVVLNTHLAGVATDFSFYLPPVATLDVQLESVTADFQIQSEDNSEPLPDSGYSPAVSFQFSGSDYLPVASFDFLPEPPVVEPGDLQAILDVTLESAGSEFLVANINNSVNLAVTLEGARADFTAEFDYNVHRLIVSEYHSTVQKAQPLTIKQTAQRNTSTKRSSKTASQQQAATFLDHKMPLHTQQATPLRIIRCGTVDDATRLIHIATAPVQAMTAIPLLLASRQQQAETRQKKACSVTEQMTAVQSDPIHAVVEDSGNSVKTECHIRIIDDPNPYTPALHFVIEGDETADGRFVFEVSQGKIEFIRQQFLGIVSSQVNTDWQQAQTLNRRLCSAVEQAQRPPPGTSVWIDHPREPPVIPPGHQTFIIPEKTAYIMQHNLLVTLSDLTPINVSSVDISLDTDSFAWSFSGSLIDKSQVSLMKQAGTVPVQLFVTINGLPLWKVIVERIERTRRFGKNVISIKGRGLSALLSQPYQLASSATQGSNLTVQQIADLQLPSGWAINWTAKTWLVPGGAYSHQNRSPIQAIMDIARNIGAIAVPSTDSQVLNIRPRYPVLPWQFDQAEPDIIIPESAILELVERPVVESQINAVYIHGSETGGELGWCRLNGTAGDRLAPTESNHLLTDSIALRALGERILAGQYTQPAIQSMTLQVSDDIPLMAIGQLIETTVRGIAIRGIINSVSISANFAKVRQTIQIGEETANNWTLFKDLLPADPLLVATLSSTDGKTSVMTLLDNGVVRVRGTGTVGNKYYIRSGKIDGDAPNLVQSEIVL